MTITVTTPGGTVTSTADYKFQALPTITSFTPTYGTTTGGTTVTITAPTSPGPPP